MEKMPYQPGADLQASLASSTSIARTEWQRALPHLAAGRVVLRELRPDDAPSLYSLLTAEEVARFISPPPTSVEGFERFIAWTHRQRAAGAYVCYAVTLRGHDTAIGIFQLRRLDAAFNLAEWGFALGSPFWGTGIFEESARLVLDFAFDAIGVRRLEARAAVLNGRGNGALRKIGAVQECVLRRSFTRGGVRFDQALYAILDVDRAARAASSALKPWIH
jgi:RimJ/RimL family protein N-acetyltransferase